MRYFTRLAVQPCHDFFHIVKRRAFFQLAGTRKDKGRHTKPLANAEGIAVPRNADDKVVGRRQCLFVKLYECIFDAARLVSKFFISLKWDVMIAGTPCICRYSVTDCASAAPSTGSVPEPSSSRSTRSSVPT